MTTTAITFKDFLIQWVVREFNAKYGYTYLSSSFVVVKIPNDQNSRCAYEVYSNDPTILVRIRVYMQLADQSTINIEKIKPIDEFYTGSVDAQIYIQGQYENVTIVGYHDTTAVAEENAQGLVKTVFVCHAWVGSEIINMNAANRSFLTRKKNFFKQCPQLDDGVVSNVLGRESNARIPLFRNNTLIQVV